jgi:predicted TIM-barrel fold metal-dependent hydrolase
MVLIAAPVAWSQDTRKKPVEKYGVPVVQGPMDAILLKDYAPDTSLRVPQTVVPKAQFPVIDVHAHVNAETPLQIAEWIRVMDEVGIKQTIILTGATGAEFDRLAGLYLRSHPERFQLYCGLDISGIDAADYPSRAVRELERCHAAGARGVGEMSDKGWGFGGSSEAPLPRDRRLHPDDPRLDLFWEKCADLRMPVNLHIADHPSCWQPLGPSQERTPDFQVFNLYGKDVPSFDELMAARDRMLTRHPKTTVIACHLSNQGHDLDTLSKVLDRFPNLYLDISARDYEVGRQPRNAAKFLMRYKDRVLFGTDMGRDKHMYQGWWRLLETADEFIPGRIWWRYYGLQLPAPVLQSIYRENALRLMRK